MTWSPSGASRWLAWAPALAGAAGVLLLAWIAAADPPEAGGPVLAAIVLAALTLALTLRTRLVLRRQTRSGAAPERPGPGERAPAGEAFEALPEPALVIAAREPGDLGDCRVQLANRAARELLRITESGAPLVSALRDPRVLETAQAALFQGLDADADYVSGGLQERFWRVEARGLPAAPDGTRLAVLYLRDETEGRRLDRMRADFMANASHELRSPLASLTGFIETLKGAARDDPAARERFLDIMAVQGERMSRLIADLLSLSRIELEEHIAPEGKADLALIAGDVIDALTPALKARKVTAVVRGEAGAAEVRGDRDQIVQVVQNLAENALKYSPDGGVIEIDVIETYRPLDPAMRLSPNMPRLALLRPAHEPQARYAALRVRDHGQGIGRQQLPRLTERFYRVEGQKSGDRMGTGLGLAIVKHIVNRHAGGLIVESEPGHGSAFTVYLPRVAADPSTGPGRRRNKSVMQAS